MSSATGRAALAIGGVAAAGAIGDLALRLATGAGSELLRENSTGGDVAAVGYAVAGTYLARVRPRNRVGWVLLAVALTQGVSGFAGGWAQLADAPGRTLAAWLASWLWFPGFALLPTVLVALYPTGEAGRRRRLLIRASLTGALAVGLCLALVEDAIDDVVPGMENPIAVPGLGIALGIVGAVILLPCVLLALADAGRRLWRGRSPEREQLAWLLCTVVIAVGFSYLPLGAFGLLTSLFVPVAIAVGIVRHRLLDLQVVVRRTLLFAGLTAGVVGVFVLSIALLSGPVGGDRLPVALAAGVVAVGLTPARNRLQRAVDRLVYGERHDPLRAVASLGRHVAEQHDETLLVPQVLSTVAAAVRSPYVALLQPDGSLRAETGSPVPTDPLHLPLQVGGRVVGCLALAPRTARDPWSAQDRELLDLLARQVAVVAHADRLNAELAGSRDLVLQATAEERQRLHQELHDGLGPALSGIALGLEAAEAALQRSPDRVALLLARLREETQAAGREVRRLVEGLRPSALEGQDLGAALGAFAEGLREAAAGRLDVGLDLPPLLPALPPDVDAAAYRIVTEAVTNVVRHSGARTCRVRLTCDGASLRLVVDDDGSGLPVQPRDGVGLVSMRRRAAELGGSWTAGPGRDGGTRVEVMLPISRGAEVPG